MPLTREQFLKAREAGYSVEQIAEFEKKRSSQSQAQPQMEPQNIFGFLAGNAASGSARAAAQANPNLLAAGPAAGLVASTGLGGPQVQQEAVRGSIQPSSVPTYSEKEQQRAVNAAGQLPMGLAGPAGAIGGTIAGSIGSMADMWTNPNDVLMQLLSFRTGARVSKSDVGKLIKYEGSLQQARKSKVALDQLRTKIGQAKDLAIQEVADVPTDFNLSTMSKKAIDAIQNPVYQVEFNEHGGLVQTVKNLDRVKEALGDLISSPKVWEEAPKKELRIVKQLYGQASEAMKVAARKAGKPIDQALKSYHEFMINYNKIRPSITDAAGQALGNKLKHAFRITSEPAIKEAWREVSKSSPVLKGVMNSMKRRELLNNLLKISGGAAAIATGYSALKTIRD